MAAPHVSGLVAILIGRDTTLTPADVAKTLSDKALDGIPTDARESFLSMCVRPPDAEVNTAGSHRHCQKVAPL